MDTRNDSTIVEIFGQTYNVRGEGDPDYLSELARFVDARMREVAAQVATVDPKTARPAGRAAATPAAPWTNLSPSGLANNPPPDLATVIRQSEAADQIPLPKKAGRKPAAGGLYVDRAALGNGKLRVDR